MTRGIDLPDNAFRKIKYVLQIEGEPFREWYTDDVYFDLTVWYSEEGSIFGYQLTYGLHRDDHIVTWMRDRGLSHHKLDTGEDSPLHNLAPILVEDGVMPTEAILTRFHAVCETLNKEIIDTVVDTLEHAPR
ncbi:MAG: hypothetical protein JKX97_04370 [Candidatus Lindowbacteria bacterium]|nr:hypothetical protein [Candidatus Lindowbacteria bacterium]